MGDLLIRNVPKRTLDSLKARAKQKHRSVQAEALEVLESVNLTAGDRMLAWLEVHPQPGLQSGPGLRAIREDRDMR